MDVRPTFERSQKRSAADVQNIVAYRMDGTYEWDVRCDDSCCRVAELYNHKLDSAENQNVSDRPKNLELIAQLTNQLHAGWHAILPLGE